jgi:hypothetical protein
MDDVWKWVGFSRKDPCKRIIEKHFTKDIDYKVLLHQIVEKVHGGHNKERLLMNIETFKSLCLLANTELINNKQLIIKFCLILTFLQQ